MSYFIQAVVNNLNAKCSFRCTYSKIVCLFFLCQEAKSLKTGILFCGIYFRFIKYKLQLSLNVGKKEIILHYPVYKERRNHFKKNILTFQHYQTLSQGIFFEWIPRLEVSGEKKMGCVRCPQ
jgi:hypothetical protein